MRGNMRADLRVAFTCQSNTIGRALGGHAAFDARSKDFPAPMGNGLMGISWPRVNNVPIQDQGQIGMCGGEAAVSWVAAMNPSAMLQKYPHAMARGLYSEATEIDNIFGVFPPTDCGTSVLAVVKAMRVNGFCSSYQWGFGLVHTLRALASGAALVAFAWRAGCDAPDSSGNIKWQGKVRGRHILLLDGSYPETRCVRLCNSWGSDWGQRGWCFMSYDDFGKALDDYGEACFPYK